MRDYRKHLEILKSMADSLKRIERNLDPKYSKSKETKEAEKGVQKLRE